MKQIKNKTAVFFVVSLWIIGVFAHSAVAEEPFKYEGEWQTTVQTEMPGMPIKLPPVTYTQCLTEENRIPQKTEENQDCEIVEQNFSGNKATWHMICKDGQSVIDNRGEIVYTENTFEGVFRSTIKEPGEDPMTITNKLTGKKIGPCKK